MQLRLSILEDPTPAGAAWEQLNEKQQQAVIEALVRLITQAVMAPPSEEPSHD